MSAFPSILAITFAVPTSIAFTTPATETVAFAEFDVTHSTVRPVNSFPSASNVFVLNVVDVPGESTRLSGEMLILEVGTGLIVTIAEPVWVSLFANI